MIKKKIASIKVVKPGSAPDIDSDFATYARDLALEHCEDVYGHDNVSNIVTFSTLAAKGAFKQACTIYSVPFVQANKIAALVPPPIEGVDCSIDDIFNPKSSRYSEGADFRSATSGSEWTKIVECAKAIEGRNKATGVHPCGVVMSSKPLHDVIPLQVRESDNRVISQWTYKELESLGLIKMDFLGLDTVDLIQHTVEYISKNGKNPPNMIEIIHGPMDDPKTYEMLSRGETIGLFQLASPGVQDLLRRMKPDRIDDIVATTALYRPGPMGMLSHVKYADRKNGREKVEYPVHPEFKGTPLEKILEKTFLLVVYQEQVMQISNQIAGMTLQEGDQLRKAMGKKDINVMLSMKTKFVEGAKANGYSDEAVNLLWDTIATFAEYGFNKCLAERSLVSTGDGKITIKDLYKKFIESPEQIYIDSMWENGEIKLHKVMNITQTGRKPLYKVITKSGRKIRITKEHRMLTTSGYGTIEDGKVKVGAELISDSDWNKRLPKKTLETKARTMSAVNRLPSMRKSSRERMIAYQSTLSFKDRSAHQKEISRTHPERHLISLKFAQEKLKELRNDEEWMSNFIDIMREVRESQYQSGEYSGFGKQVALSNGMICDSIVEALAGEYLISRGIDFEIHKKLSSATKGTIKECDFYVNGLYFEMDGLNRGRDYFVREKYGEELPFVYLTPQNYIDAIDEAIMSHHIENGDEIVEIIPPKIGSSGKTYTEMTYDIEMSQDGPSNFIADGLVSHNSHSVAYGINAYQSAYLKANYPIEFMAALIAQNVGNKDKILAFLQEADRMKLKVGTADINASEERVSPDYQNKTKFDIIYGFTGINSISAATAKEIVAEREENGLFTSIQDVVQRCMKRGIGNRKNFENLALAGAFDSFGISRKAIVDNLDFFMKDSKVKQNKGTSLFDMFDDSSDDDSSIDLTNDDEYPHLEKLQKEASVIGFYLTSHPMSHIGKLSGARTITLDKMLKAQNNMYETVIATITEINTKRMRRGGKSVTVVIDDNTSYVTAVLDRPIVKGIDKRVAQNRLKKLYESGANSVSVEIKELIEDSSIVSMPELEVGSVYRFDINMRPGFDGNQPNFRIKSASKVSLDDDGTLPVRIRLPKPKTKEEKKDQLSFIKKMSVKYPGNSPMFLTYVDREIYSSVEDDDHIYESAIEVMTSDDSEKEEREWPPPNVAPILSKKNGKTEILAKIESLNYSKITLTVDKGPELADELERKFGIENFDFGVFSPALLDD